MQTYAESQGYRLTGHDGRQHHVWARSDAEAIRQGRRWGGRHGGLARLEHLTLTDEQEGCWDRATARAVALEG